MIKNQNSKLTRELIEKCESTKKVQKKKDNSDLTQDDIMKYEIAEELGLLDIVSDNGWSGLSAKQAGKIGGLLTARKKQLKKANEINEEKKI